MAEDVNALLNERENRFGGKIIWRGFSLYYGDNRGFSRERGVFVFRIADRIYFEDFEVVPKILGIPVAQKNKSEYVKFEDSFNISDVSTIRDVTKKSAVSFVDGKLKNLKTASLLAKFFREIVQCVEFKDGSVMFFQFAGSSFEKALK